MAYSSRRVQHFFSFIYLFYAVGYQEHLLRRHSLFIRWLAPSPSLAYVFHIFWPCIFICLSRPHVFPSPAMHRFGIHGGGGGGWRVWAASVCWCAIHVFLINIVEDGACRAVAEGREGGRDERWAGEWGMWAMGQRCECGMRWKRRKEERRKWGWWWKGGCG